MRNPNLFELHAIWAVVSRAVVPRPLREKLKTILSSRGWAITLALVAFTGNASAGPRDAQWKGVDEAVNNGLPQTAIERLDPIVAAAIAQKSYPEAIKAISRKIALEGGIQGNRAEEKISRFQIELDKAPAVMKPAMEAILAHWYWQYFQQNRWRFMQRTQTGAASGPDLQTWDLARILEEIDRHFTAALADDQKVKAMPIGAYDDLLARGNAPDSYRPTLFDFLAHEALQFYQTGEHAASIAEDNFEISADDPILGPIDSFLKWRPQTTDVASPKLKAIQLYQALLAFHEKDSDRSAFDDADLSRLQFGHNVSVGDAKDSRYKTALENFIEKTAAHEISAAASAILGAQLNAEGSPAEARAWAARGYSAFPSSLGGAACFNLIQQIEAKSAAVQTEHVWNAPWPTLNVTYRNVTKIYFRAVPFDLDDLVSRSRWGLGNFDQDERATFMHAKPVLEWNADLPPTTDFKEHTEQLAAPTSLKPGFYFVIASHDPRFQEPDNQLSVAEVCVSDLALVLRTNQEFGRHDGFVLNAVSGEPAVGATVRLWERNRDGYLKPSETLSTDKDGRFHYAANDKNIFLVADYNGQSVSSEGEVYANAAWLHPRKETQTVFFTDRALYRPGQTINYKGVSISYDKRRGEYAAVADQSITVVFNDPNGHEIARATHRTNDYGSFSGVFTAPRDRLMGRMSIQQMGTPNRTAFNVEEYKRPKFQVELKAPVEAAKLGAIVDVTGKAAAYTGAAIGGAKVKWRVERRVQLPLWCWWWQPPAIKAIAHGTAVSDADGTFKVQFPAQPDPAVPAKNEPKFVFRIHVDVTDSTGETRSNERSVAAGYTALEASLTAEEWQTADTAVAFSVATNSLDGDPQTATGTVRIFALKQPSSVQRIALVAQTWWTFFGAEPKSDPTNPDSWELGELVNEHAFTTDATGKAKIDVPLKVGIYRATLETADRFGKTVTARHTVQVVNPRDAHYAVKLANHFAAPKWSIEPGETFTALWGTGYAMGRAFVELECKGERLKSYWTAPDRTQEMIAQAVSEEMRGGFTLRVTYVRENRAYTNTRVVDVPWSNKQLSVKWESFRSKLTPGQKETWTAVVTGPNAKRATAEMVATLYDASLDQYAPHAWPHVFSVFREEVASLTSALQNSEINFAVLHTWDGPRPRWANWSYRSFPADIIRHNEGEDGVIVLSPFMIDAGRGGGRRANATLAGSRVRTELADTASTISVATQQFLQKSAPSEATDMLSYLPESKAADAPGAPPDLNQVVARKNLNETAFFFPQLLAGDDGIVKLVFTMPEALTEWRFLGFAHDKDLRSGFLSEKVVTSKDLMVEPNAPRFVREGDTLEFTVKVSNQSDTPQSGTVKLTFADAGSQASVDAQLANRDTEQPFELPAKQSRSYSWRIAVPDGLGFLSYKAVAATSKASDGEEGYLPVLSKRILVTESLPLPIRGKSTKQFEFKKLVDSGTSTTLRHESLTVEMVSQPAWYAVMALPYLMEYPYECSEQVFNRLYANALARHIANSDPKIRRVFDRWKATPALESPLEKNQDLKSVMLEETPWLRQAKKETEARKNVGLLFDENRLNDESARALRTLTDQQLGDGLWPWFPGGRSNEYISLYIMTGFGRLRHLGVDVDTGVAVKSLAALDAWIEEGYLSIQKTKTPEDHVPSDTEALYLYGRSFFLEDQPISPAHRTAVDFFLQQARKYWVRVDSRQSQAHLALALQRFGDKETPQAILKSIKERSITEEELGMHWRDSDFGWWWYSAPIETQAVMIEAFAEITGDTQAVEDCKVWLLKEKQTQAWPTTKATADAVYGLLLRGSNLLASDALVQVSLGGTPIKPENVEAGTGYYRQKFVRDEIKPAMGHIEVKKTDDGVSWGGVHWQYLEDVSKVTPHIGTPLQLKKTLFVKETTAKGQVLKPVNGPVSVGDELVVRIELRTDRAMEYVHLKDQRGSGTEPVNVLSRYRYQDGLAYYESTRDTASHFFIDYLPRGVYVFEYSVRVQLKGRYETGLAEIQCMYAPEFNSHSESIALEVK